MKLFTAIKNKFVKEYNDATPAEIPKKSVFLEDGRLTPQEFTDACDRLILSSSMWSWASATPEGFREPVLDPKKQFLKAKTVSRSRLKDDPADIQTIGEDGDFLVMGTDLPKEPEKFEKEEKKPAPKKANEARDWNDSDDDEITEVKATDKPGEEEDPKRIYEVHITYDRHYLTPRLWLTGVDSKNRPLTQEQIMEEVMKEYRDKTVTYDKQPHTGEFMINIHPCKHANVLKSFAEQAIANGNEVRPDQSLFLFLKFISSVMPTVEIDFTVEMQL